MNNGHNQAAQVDKQKQQCEAFRTKVDQVQIQLFKENKISFNENLENFLTNGSKVTKIYLHT